jgi:hypothetical protein
MGLEHGQLDTGWEVLKIMERLGLVYSIGAARPADRREDLVLDSST